jgi:hypothetical protein
MSPTQAVAVIGSDCAQAAAEAQVAQQQAAEASKAAVQSDQDLVRPVAFSICIEPDALTGPCPRRILQVLWSACCVLPNTLTSFAEVF